MAEADWARAAADALVEAGVVAACYVPDSVTEKVHQAFGGRVHTVRLNREEEGVGIAAGYWLAGQKACLLMQNTGLGNCINAILGLVTPMRIPAILVVSLRGVLGEFNPAQIPIGLATERLLEAIGIPAFTPRHAGEVHRIIDGAAQLAEAASTPIAILLSAELTGGKRAPKA
ncbi:MAG: phosphonopyruvate decarboxylase [Candidatus Dormibacteraceae bacterium]